MRGAQSCAQRLRVAHISGPEPHPRGFEVLKMRKKYKCIRCGKRRRAHSAFRAAPCAKCVDEEVAGWMQAILSVDPPIRTRKK